MHYYYFSFRVFNRHILWRHDKFLLPWKTVAAKLGLPDVCSGLGSFWGQMERSLSNYRRPRVRLLHHVRSSKEKPET